MTTVAARRRVALAALCAGAVLPQATAQAPSPTVRVAALLGELDAAFNAGDSGAYLGRFAPEQPLLQQVHARATRERLAGGRRLQRRSEIADPPRQCGPRLVASVRTTTQIADDPAHAPLLERGYLVLRELGSVLVPVLAIDLPASGAPCTDRDLFECDACNYRIGNVAGWLCVPVNSERSGAVEGSTFVHLGADLVLEVSVRFATGSATAVDVVAGLARDLQAAVRGCRAAAPAPWEPPGFRLPARATGARAALELADDQRLVLHATVFGPLQHLLLLRGSAAAIAAHGDAIEALLRSYQLLRTDAALAAQAARALLLHTGGRLGDDGCYQNPKHAVVAKGPAGWPAEQRCEGAAFEVVWSCPAGVSRVRVAGHRPPDGMRAWSAAMADRWLEMVLARTGIGQLDEDSSWSPPDAAGDRERTLTGTDHSGQRRFLRCLLRADLLLLADGATAPGHDPEPLRAALASVQRP